MRVYCRPAPYTFNSPPNQKSLKNIETFLTGYFRSETTCTQSLVGISNGLQSPIK